MQLQNRFQIDLHIHLLRLLHRHHLDAAAAAAAGRQMQVVYWAILLGQQRR